MSAPRLVDLEEDDLDWMAASELTLFGRSAWSGTLIRDDWRYGGSRYRAVRLVGELVAYAVYGFEGEAFHLMNLAVLPEHRRHGLARLLMDDFLEQANELGAADAWLEVAVDNEAALALYRAYGFEDVRVRRKYYQPEGTDALVMRLALRPEGESAAD
ncbi:ribosomal protein S18-alanine N-acetyltransferase [Demequina sp. NBRC 110052]|uniref:ribosomal protein S18-alanine N-acetyltransferase n=1 Tax=Demequina sp. NBRC 110052 TaxID=1570341 RepID=UPI000A04C526|nr:ribosomal protein S18-alanine N-acetyltransferase [Demequina sp. NBRC 110052]